MPSLVKIGQVVQKLRTMVRKEAKLLNQTLNITQLNEPCWVRLGLVRPTSLVPIIRARHDILCYILELQLYPRNMTKKRPLGRTRSRWENNIKMDLKEINREVADCIDLAQSREKWRAVVNTVMDIWVPPNAGNFLNSWETGSFEDRLRWEVCRH